MPEHIGSYPSIFAFGHPAVATLTHGPVIVQEKVDGSQFSFGVTLDGEIVARSKGKDLVIDAPEKMFERAIESVRERSALLRPGWIYRGEYLQKPKHNTLAYERTPVGNVILFDVTADDSTYLSCDDVALEARRIGLEHVPTLYRGMLESSDKLRELLDNVSVLGGQKIEGVVVKPMAYDRYGVDKKVLMAKYVSEAFKEIHGGEWKKANPTKGDVLDDLVASLRTPARYNKAIQHMRDDGTLTDSPKDIGPLLKVVQSDVRKECEDHVKEKLFQWAWPHIQRGVVAGFPEWYKNELLDKQFSK